MGKIVKDRRRFIKTSIKASIATGLFWPTASSGAHNAVGADTIGFTQQPLPYGFHVLEPVIDGTTMEIHYSRHATGYAKNLSDACLEEKVNTTSSSMIDLLKNISRYSLKMRNNAGGHYNHEFFWRLMTAPLSGGVPAGKLLSCINKDFGSVEAMKNQFNDVAKTRFGSGWAWLIYTAQHRLVVLSTPNQDNPLMNISEVQGIPILALDVWEHAYYLQYQNKRADYITAWWQLVNWQKINNDFETLKF
jgi:Fe-Mn family superoxide dismutase